MLLVGVVTGVQLAAYAWLQFGGTVQTLEQHYFSSTLWAGAGLTVAITIAELARPLSDRPLARWLPAAALLAVPLGYEADPHVPPFGWLPFGAIVAAAVIVAAAAARGGARLRHRLAAATATGLALAAFAGAILVLTVAPIPPHPRLSHTIFTPKPAYASALGGSATSYIDNYRIATALPGFVGPATYRGEQVFVWRMTPYGWLYDIRMYHGHFDSLPSTLALTAYDRRKLNLRQPAQLLLLGSSTASFPTALRELAYYRPALTRAGQLRAGPLVLHVWIIRLGRYYHPPTSH
jgi:hypothetical protein